MDMTDPQPGDGVYLGSQYHEYVGPVFVSGVEIPEMCLVSRLGGEPRPVFRRDVRRCTEADTHRGTAYSALRHSGRRDPK